MSIFTKNELEYMGEQRLGRLATVDVMGSIGIPVMDQHIWRVV